MITQQLIIDRLKDRLGDKWRGIEKASALIDALDSFPGGPMIYVLPAARSASPNQTGTQQVRQRVGCTYQLLLGFSRDGERFDDIDVASEEVIMALLGWQAPSESNVMEYGGGGLVPVDLEAGVIFWADNFVVASQLRSA